MLSAAAEVGAHSNKKLVEFADGPRAHRKSNERDGEGSADNRPKVLPFGELAAVLAGVHDEVLFGGLRTPDRRFLRRSAEKAKPEEGLEPEVACNARFARFWRISAAALLAASDALHPRVKDCMSS
mmetsp:Transcript_133808/g.427802  ORF Transcript_133808/g.427802 Transcript_133808/m.427802 type:complete len:126 (+) Transcript_133808:34-411(+)